MDVVDIMKGMKSDNNNISQSQTVAVTCHFYGEERVPVASKTTVTRK
jgi:hypothetical protein